MSMENKQAFSVLTAEPEIQLNPPLVEKALDVKVVFYRIGEWGFLQMSRVFSSTFLQVDRVWGRKEA